MGIAVIPDDTTEQSPCSCHASATGGNPYAPTDDLLDWKGRVVVDLHGRRIGRIVDVQFTSETDVPEWGSIRFGRLGLRRRFVPLGDAELLAGQVRVPYTKAMVQGAPAWPQASCRPPRDHALREYYGLGEEPPP